MNYSPSTPPNDPAQLPLYIQQELLRIKQAMDSAQPFIRLQIIHSAPERVFAGMFIYADGTDYDPGSGVGLYRRNEANNAWVFIG